MRTDVRLNAFPCFFWKMASWTHEPLVLPNQAWNLLRELWFAFSPMPLSILVICNPALLGRSVKLPTSFPVCLYVVLGVATQPIVAFANLQGVKGFPHGSCKASDLTSLNAEVGRDATIWTGQAPAHPEECLNFPASKREEQSPPTFRKCSSFTAGPVPKFPHSLTAAAQNQWEFWGAREQSHQQPWVDSKHWSLVVKTGFNAGVCFLKFFFPFYGYFSV